jgi:hypothetical protein
VRAFELDPKTTSKYDITQSLWDMIDPQAAWLLNRWCCCSK